MDHVTETNPHFLTRSSLRAIKGFLLDGSKVRVCQADGSWTGHTTYCDGKPKTVKHPGDGGYSPMLAIRVCAAFQVWFP